MKRTLLTVPVVLVCLSAWGTAPSGQQPAGPTVSADLATHPAGSHKHRVIVQAQDSALSLLRHGLHGVLKRDLPGSVALEVTDAQLEALEHDPQYGHISGDLPILPNASVTNAVTGATQVWQGTPGLLLGLGGIPGTTGGNGNVTVAVVDSGIATHNALDSRVLKHVNFVTDEPGVTGDPFGHGTHVAGIIAGNRTAATYVTSQFSGGSAPSVRLVDVRVLGALGSGRTSDVIAGIEWVINNASTYHIRVINLSLGHPVMEPWFNDPLCQEVERAVSKGLTVSVSAGNYGLTSDGRPVLGGITSPGNSPDAITVGAIDTADTTSTSDDTLAPYSSKGPAQYDIVVKPDLVAPGTKIVSLEAPGSYLSTNYPQWHIAGSGNNAYMRLTGTSMATAVVSGGAALVLSDYPGLSPSQLKIALQMGARFMPSAGLVGAGTGVVNFQQSMKLAQQGLLNTILQTLSSLLGASSGATYKDRGTLIDGIYNRTGIKLLGILDLSALFGGANTAQPGVLNLLGTGNPLGYTGANYIVWGNVASYSNSYYIVWGNSIQTTDGQYIVWGNSEYTDSNYIVWGNSVPGGH
jgi:serine protease AprX